jgi:hypothetical protein
VVYQAGDPQKGGEMKRVRCCKCGKILFAVNDDGLAVLPLGAILSKIDGVCECGRGFHYSVTDRLLERIIERYNQRTEVTG